MAQPATKSKRKRGRPKLDSSTVRLNLLLPEAMYDRIEQLQHETDAASIAELIRRAITVYASLHEAHRDDMEVIVRSRDGSSEHQIILF